MNNAMNIKMLSEDSLIFLEKNINLVTEKVLLFDDNDWIYKQFPQPMFVEKKYHIPDFVLEDNPESFDKDIDFINSIRIFENLSTLPRFILSDQRFWLWLHFEKFYHVVRKMLKIRSTSTIKNMWMHSQGPRRGLMFGVLSRCYFRVALTLDENESDKYHLTKWIIENPERFRNLTWRSFSSQEHLVRGVLKGEKRAIEENPNKENNELYPIIAKYVSLIGSVRLLDKISENDISDMVYRKMIELLESKGQD